MRVLLIHRYFWPDSPPYASMLRVIGSHLADQGHEVTVLTTQPSYTSETAKQRRPKREALDGVRVVRKWMLPESKGNWIARLANAALLQIHVFLHIAFRRNRYDLVTASTMPPVVIGAVSCAATRLRRGRFLYHCMDLYPEVAEIAGSRLLGRGPVRAVLAWVDRRTCKKAWRVVVLSEDMLNTLLLRGCDARNVRIVNNFALEDQASSTATGAVLAGGRPGAFRVLFAGNIGRFQGLESVLEVAQELPKDLPIEFHFLGDGAARAKLEQQAGALLGTRVFFHGFRPLEEALQAMHEADLGIVSLQPRVITAAFPSKTMTYLSAGLPILALVESDSALAKLVREHEVGLTVDQSDRGTLAQELQAFAQDPARVRACRERALRLAESQFSSSAVLNQWDEVLGELSRERDANDAPGQGVPE